MISTPSPRASLAGRLLGGAILCAGVWLGGCSKKPPPAAGGTPASTNGVAKAPLPAGATNPARADIDRVEERKSFFLDRPNQGRDPFFPTSDRRAPSETDPAVAKTPAVKAASNLVVKTIFPGSTRRAWINNRSFIEGEVGVLKLVDGTRVTLHCVEIRDESVIVEIEGVPGRKELPLRRRF